MFLCAVGWYFLQLEGHLSIIVIINWWIFINCYYFFPPEGDHDISEGEWMTHTWVSVCLCIRHQPPAKTIPVSYIVDIFLGKGLVWIIFFTMQFFGRKPPPPVTAVYLVGQDPELVVAQLPTSHPWFLWLAVCQGCPTSWQCAICTQCHCMLSQECIITTRSASAVCTVDN